MASHTTRIERHPDVMALRDRYARASSKPRAQAIEGLGLLTGLYLAISPWIVGFNGTTTLTVNNLVTGIALAVLAAGFGTAYERTYGMGWVAGAIGVWTIIAPWVVAGSADTTRSIVNNVITGGVAVLLAMATSALGRMEQP